MRRKKGFTLIELLVVIAIIAMLMAILLPALGKVKRLAARIVDAAHMRGIGQSCIVYSNDYDDEYPVAGGRGNNAYEATRTRTEDGAEWWDPDATWGGDDTVTVSASLYLLVKYADVSPEIFSSPAGSEKEFQLSEELPDNVTNVDVIEAWDFGEEPGRYVTYAYHMPYANGRPSAYPITGMASSAKAVLASRNPWYDKELTPGAPATDDESHLDYVNLIGSENLAGDEWDSIARDELEIGNSNDHLREGQNVFFVGGNTEFENRPDCGVEEDNIYTMLSGSTPSDWSEHWKRRRGYASLDFTIDNAKVKMESDNNLVNDLAP